MNSVININALTVRRREKAALKMFIVLSLNVKMVNVSVLRKYRNQKQENK